MPVKPTTTDGIKQVHETYITPPAVVKAHVDYADLQLCGDPKFILDPCAGTGNYGVYLRQKYPNAYIAGVEIQTRDELLKIDPNFDANKANYTVWYEQSIFEHEFNSETEYYDLIITNPPFSLTEGLVAHLWNFLDNKR
jgi:methylase of polypeptide subunit release factors